MLDFLKEHRLNLHGGLHGGQKARVQVLGAGDIEDKIEILLILYDII